MFPSKPSFWQGSPINIFDSRRLNLGKSWVNHSQKRRGISSRGERPGSGFLEGTSGNRTDLRSSLTRDPKLHAHSLPAPQTWTIKHVVTFPVKRCGLGFHSFQGWFVLPILDHFLDDFWSKWCRGYNQMYVRISTTWWWFVYDMLCDKRSTHVSENWCIPMQWTFWQGIMMISPFFSGFPLCFFLGFLGNLQGKIPQLLYTHVFMYIYIYTYLYISPSYVHRSPSYIYRSPS